MLWVLFPHSSGSSHQEARTLVPLLAPEPGSAS